MLAAGAAFALSSGFHSWAQEYPNRPIRFLVGNAPGGGTDTVARLVASKMSEGLGMSVIVDNRPGGTGAVAATLVARASPDGYSILIITRSSHSISPALQRNLPFHPVNDFAAISLLVNSPNVLVAHTSVPANSVKELVAVLKSKPESFNYGSTGTGAVSHMAAELFKNITGTKITHVPYKGASPALSDLLSGRVQLMFSGPASIIPHVNSGKLKALAVGGSKRTPALKDVLTFAEAGYPAVEASQWYGVVTTAGTPNTVINRLNREVVRVLQLPDMEERLINGGFDPEPSTPQQFAQLLKEDVARWQKVVKATGIRLE
ncbi:MAG: tripartite tricarboxylate transporter substrate binding protein [Betaproteobacteria bacterium]|nr:tripartite tricarboxylate transporter substrate binding protein [Betaproteobacteria bacterium]